MSSEMKIEKKGSQYMYSWDDDLGHHQYYCEDLGDKEEDLHLGYSLEEKSVHHFKRSINSDGSMMYSWDDNFGHHQYYLSI
jgi:hypothetical protein